MSSRSGTDVPAKFKPTFMDLLLGGEVLAQDIDSFIDAWHDAPDGSEAASLSLAEFLGVTAGEYRLWVEQPDSLRFIAAAHKAGQPVETLLASRDRLGLAARASDQNEAEKLVQWLIKRGRIEGPRKSRG
ncbi:MAG: hypothetical protein ACRDOI_39155 [Trebonia sp.]